MWYIQKGALYGSKNQIKSRGSKALYKTLSLHAYIIEVGEFFSDSSGTSEKEHDF